jgi:iron complex transport system substrate-binding protein
MLRACALALFTLCAPLAGAAALPTVVSTNLCADMLALSLAAPAQLLSVSRKSQDPRVSSMAERAREFPVNDATAEEIIALNPDIVLASRRWQAHNQAELLSRHGIKTVVVPYPTTWQQIFDSTSWVAGQIGREASGAELVADVQARLARLQQRPRPFSALYLRANGGSAGANTYVDTVFQALGLNNHMASQGRSGWSRYALEELIASPPDLFVSADMRIDNGYAKSAYSRHQRLQQLMATRPVLSVSGNRWGCSDWQLVYAAEELAAQLDALSLASRPLKNVGEAAEARQKQARKRSLRVVNEHSEPVFNDASATQVVFQQPASGVQP